MSMNAVDHQDRRACAASCACRQSPMRRVDAIASSDSSSLPSAAGGTARPTTPASATIVSTYGIISTNWDGIELQALQLDLQRLRGREQQAREAGARRLPPAEDRRGERDEAAARGHAVGELVLVERQVRAAERRRARRDSSTASQRTRVDRHADRRAPPPDARRPRARAARTACGTAATPTRGQREQRRARRAGSATQRARDPVPRPVPSNPATRGELDELSNASRRKNRVSADGQQVDRDADHDLVGAEADRRQRVQQRRAATPPAMPREHADPRRLPQ